VPKRTALLALLSAAAIGVITAGCGSGGNKSLTKDDFVSQASSICSKASQKLEAVGQSFFKSGANRTEADFVNQKVVPIFQQELIDRIDALGAPKGDESDVNAILDAGRQGLAKLKKNPLLIRAAQGSAKDPLAEMGRLATAYGIRCGG
jgi:hypothetical protein